MENLGSSSSSRLGLEAALPIRATCSYRISLIWREFGFFALLCLMFDFICAASSLGAPTSTSAFEDKADVDVGASKLYANPARHASKHKQQQHNQPENQRAPNQSDCALHKVDICLVTYAQLGALYRHGEL